MPVNISCDHDPTYTLATLQQCDRWVEQRHYPDQRLVQLRWFDGKRFHTYFAPEGDLQYLLTAGKVECEASPRLAELDMNISGHVSETTQKYWRALPDAD